MTLKNFKNKLENDPNSIEFSETMAVIDNNYNFSPTTFTNGTVHNVAGENSGSCKLFAFAKLQDFSKAETLACFGTFYFNDVLKDPKGKDHQNIRNFMQTGFEGLQFETEALIPK
ncbi:HopJ type III effector protein [Maribacter sp. 2210JD10-5]|uniref:HopJ type III effector protein n=1 Tax=Maribacter sp. 2210JD10-5 TaxID=3386272 RepID=UPI0039BC9A49